MSMVHGGPSIVCAPFGSAGICGAAGALTLGGAGINPHDVAGITCSLIKDTLMTHTTTVTKWECSEGSTNDFTQSGVLEPIYAAGALQSDGTGHAMVSGVTANNAITASAFTIYAVASVAASNVKAGTPYLSDAICGDNAGYLCIHTHNLGGALKAFGYAWDGGAKYTADVSLSAGTKYVFEMRLDAGTLYLYANGSTVSIACGNLASVAYYLTLLATAGGSYGSYTVDDMRWFNVALSEANRMGIRAYLASLYGATG